MKCNGDEGSEEGCGLSYEMDFIKRTDLKNKTTEKKQGRKAPEGKGRGRG